MLAGRVLLLRLWEVNSIYVMLLGLQYLRVAHPIMYLDAKVSNAGDVPERKSSRRINSTIAAKLTFRRKECLKEK